NRQGTRECKGQVVAGLKTKESQDAANQQGTNDANLHDEHVYDGSGLGCGLRDPSGRKRRQGRIRQLRQDEFFRLENEQLLPLQQLLQGLLLQLRLQVLVELLL